MVAGSLKDSAQLAFWGAALALTYLGAAEHYRQALGRNPNLLKLIVQGIVPKLMTHVEYRRFVESETAKFGKIMQDAKIKAEKLFLQSPIDGGEGVK